MYNLAADPYVIARRVAAAERDAALIADARREYLEWEASKSAPKLLREWAKAKRTAS